MVRHCMPTKQKPHIAVIGAGAFGGWTALHLQERGAQVTLLDAWGPGNSRASSGGETRVMRGAYGPDQPYTEMAARALTLWAKYEKRWKRHFLHRTGVLWMASGQDDAFESGSVKTLRAAKIKFQELSTPQMKKRWPQINFEGIEWAIFEPDCGYLDARASCAAVVEAFVKAGGSYRQTAVREPLEIENGYVGTAASPVQSSKARQFSLSDGTKLSADAYVFACGPWLGKLFPDVLGNLIQATRQEVFFFGTPPGNNGFVFPQMPVWADITDEHGAYTIPQIEHRGFKLAFDRHGPEFDPDTGDRMIQGIEDARSFLAERFPVLAGAPLVESRVCQYENTSTGDFLIDRHPELDHVWLVGGGSGHGFKHGPVVGEHISALIAGKIAAEPRFSLASKTGEPRRSVF